MIEALGRAHRICAATPLFTSTSYLEKRAALTLREYRTRRCLILTVSGHFPRNNEVFPVAFLVGGACAFICARLILKGKQ